jgi:hypothetical protein
MHLGRPINGPIPFEHYACLVFHNRGRADSFVERLYEVEQGSQLARTRLNLLQSASCLTRTREEVHETGRICSNMVPRITGSLYKASAHWNLRRCFSSRLSTQAIVRNALFGYKPDHCTAGHRFAADHHAPRGRCK